MHQPILLQAVVLVCHQMQFKKKKKNLYDGRRKEAKAFLKGLKHFVQREDKTFREKVKENIDNLVKEYLLEKMLIFLEKLLRTNRICL